MANEINKIIEERAKITKENPGYPSGSMIRTNIYLTQPQVHRLREEARSSGLRVAEIVRRAIDAYYDKEHT